MTSKSSSSPVSQGPNAPQEFWEAHYRRHAGPWSGVPNETVAAIARGLPPGRSLDLGCANGGDATWLGLQGWMALGVDVSQTAVDTASATAAEAGVSDRVTFERHDLLKMCPRPVSLVTASFLQTAVEFDRAAAFRRVAERIDPRTSSGDRSCLGGALVGNQEETVFPTAQETLDAIGLDVDVWQPVIVEERDRIANGPIGQTATVTDNIVLMRRVSTRILSGVLPGADFFDDFGLRRHSPGRIAIPG